MGNAENACTKQGNEGQIQHMINILKLMMTQDCEERFDEIAGRREVENQALVAGDQVDDDDLVRLTLNEFSKDFFPDQENAGGSCDNWEFPRLEPENIHQPLCGHEPIPTLLSI